VFRRFLQLCKIPKRGGIRRTIKIWQGLVCVKLSVRDGTKKAFGQIFIAVDCAPKLKEINPKSSMSQISSKFAVTISPLFPS
jgi:hypothetical protein